MAKKMRNYLEAAAFQTEPTTHNILPEVARKLPISFSFENLDLNTKPFDCSKRHGESLIIILNNLKLYSNYNIIDISGPKNNHKMPEHLVKKANLEHFANKAPTGNLHQLGKQRTSERIVGYFDGKQMNLFQVCVLDLEHIVSGD